MKRRDESMLLGKSSGSSTRVVFSGVRGDLRTGNQLAFSSSFLLSKGDMNL